jgi:hypothetical protein
MVVKTVMLTTRQDIVVVIFAMLIQLCTIVGFFLLIIFDERCNPLTEGAPGFGFYEVLAVFSAD